MFMEDEDKNKDLDTDLEVDNTDEDNVDEDNTEEVDDDLTKVTKALAKERESNKNFKKQLRDLKAAQGNKDNAGDADEKVTKAVSEANESWKGRFVNLAATNAFLAAGAPSVNKRLLNMIDLTDLEVNDDGTVDGLEDQIDEIKDEYPALFRKTRTAGPDLGPKDKTTAPKSASEIQAAKLFGRK